MFWSKYYEGSIEGDNPLVGDASSFARFVMEHMPSFCSTLIDVGAGNGRDSRFFHGQGLKVTSVDQSSEALSRLEGPERLVCDMALLPDTLPVFDILYSRFSLHSVDRRTQDALFLWASNHVKFVFIETRSMNDPRYGKGKNLGGGAFLDTHYRRFTRLSDLVEDLEQYGFETAFAEENFTDAHHGDDKAVVNRIIAYRVRPLRDSK